MKQIAIKIRLPILILVIWNLSCTANKREPDLKALSILSDFVFVGAVSYTSTEKWHEVSGRDAVQLIPQSLPQQLEIGKAYIFRHRKPLDNEKLALSELRSRFEREGLKVLQAPKSPRDMIESYIGGPFFTIKFTDGHHIGLLTNRLSADYEKQVDSGWVGEDYILVYIQ